MIRLVTSWATKEEMVLAFILDLKKMLVGIEGEFENRVKSESNKIIRYKSTGEILHWCFFGVPGMGYIFKTKSDINGFHTVNTKL